MPMKEQLIRKKIKELEERTGESQEQLERELNPSPGSELRPLTTRKRKRY